MISNSTIYKTQSTKEHNLARITKMASGIPPGPALSPKGSALSRTDLPHLTNGIWEINAGCSCFFHPPF